MGVTYKLKDEVIDFIKHHKHENPRISCRSLVGLIEEKFLIKVSKSSINAVIKEANLSSPIGRPSAKAVSPRKFALPPEKKIQSLGPGEEILKKDDKKLEEAQKLGAKVKNENVKIPDSENIFQINKFQEFKKNDPSRRNIKETLYSSCDQKAVRAEDPFKEETHFQIKFKRILMLFILRDFFSRPALDEFFKRNTSFSQREIDILDVLFCFYPDVFKSSAVALEEESRVLWKIFGWKDIPDLNEIELIIQHLKTIQIPVFDFNLEAEYFLTLVNSVSFLTEHEKTLTIDARLKSIHVPGKCVIVSPIERALSEVSSFLSGRKIFKLYCPQQCFTSDLLEQIMHICENSQNIRKISLNGVDGRVVSEIRPVNNYARGFLLNIKDQNEEKIILKKDSLPEKINVNGVDVYLEDSSKTVKEMFSHISSETKLRGVTFYDPSRDFLIYSLTNFSSPEMTNRAIFSEFLEIRQQINSENLKIICKNSESSAVKIDAFQNSVFSLVEDMLLKMQTLFWAYNSLTDSHPEGFSSVYEDVVGLVYSKNGAELKIKMDNNHSIIGQESIKNINHLFSLGYDRIKIHNY